MEYDVYGPGVCINEVPLCFVITIPGGMIAISVVLNRGTWSQARREGGGVVWVKIGGPGMGKFL